MKIDPYKRAKIMQIDTTDLNKAETIRAIQKQEGYDPCFGFGNWRCPHTKCCWRSDCLGLMGAVKPAHVFEVVD